MPADGAAGSRRHGRFLRQVFGRGTEALAEGFVAMLQLVPYVRLMGQTQNRYEGHMFDLIQVLQETLSKSALADLGAWFGKYPKGAFWYVMSDYVLDDPNKHDVVSFVILLRHDKQEVILDYIQAIAPTDIKHSGAASEGMIRYLNCPVAFSFNFVLDEEKPSFLSSYAKPENMLLELESLLGFAERMGQVSTETGDYFEQVAKRLKRFIQELKQKGNQKLARKIFILAAYAAVVFDYLDLVAEPKVLAWVSDRDAMIDRHDGVVYEIATLAFYVLKFSRTDGASIATPRLIHTLQESTGANILDPLIRMPDYLAGTIADMNLECFEFSHEKFETVAAGCLMGQKNHVVARVKWTGAGFTVQRLNWKTHEGV